MCCVRVISISINDVYLLISSVCNYDVNTPVYLHMLPMCCCRPISHYSHSDFITRVQLVFCNDCHVRSCAWMRACMVKI